MFRLAHLSDVHLGPMPPVSLQQLASKRITGYVNWRVGRRSHHRGEVSDLICAAVGEAAPSHVAVTGDLINLGLEIEFERARQWLEALGPPDRVSLVLGNHDAYVRGAFERACAAWAPWMQGDAPSGRAFPYLRVRDGIALIGASSANATAPLMATGHFRQEQADALAELLEETGAQSLYRVVMIHHPPMPGATSFHRRLVGASRFRDTVKRHGAELILHGHTHLPTLQWLDGKIPVVGVAAAGQGPGGRKPAAQFNLFEISGNPGAWRTRLTRWGLAGDVVLPLDEADLGSPPSE